MKSIGKLIFGTVAVWLSVFALIGADSLPDADELFKRAKATKDICELRNMINVGYLITRQAMERKESRGLHYTIDYPKHAYDQK